MSVIKFSEMSEQELKNYIYNKLNQTLCNVKDYFEYYINETTKQIELIAKSHDNIVLQKAAQKNKDMYYYTLWANKKRQISQEGNRNIIPKRGEIWTCDLGQNIGCEENKNRPVIIIQNDTGNQLSPTTIIVPISNRPKKISVHISIRNTDYILNDNEGVDQITGTVLCEQIRVISKSRLGYRIGTLKPEFIDTILNVKLKNSLEL